MQRPCVGEALQRRRHGTPRIRSAAPGFEVRHRITAPRTSNPGAADLQDLAVAGADGRTRPLYQHVAATVAAEWNGNGNCALVVGATWPAQLREVRAIVGDAMPLLVPGVGAQGGDVEAVVRNAASVDGTGLMVSSSRAILYASAGDDYADAAADAAKALRDAINRRR